VQRKENPVNLASLVTLKEWHKSALRSLVAGTAVAGIVALTSLAISPTAVQAESVADGVVLTASAQTLTARDYDLEIATAPMPDLAVTVSQTRDLVSQGIVLTWKGGKESTRGTGSSGGANYLQIAQCWGEDSLNPGHPDRTTCQYGVPNVQGSTRDDFVAPETIAPEDEQYTIPDVGSSYTSIPFRAVTGETSSSIEDGRISRTVQANENQFFTKLTTNFVPFAPSEKTGNGISKFEVQTVMQSPALGCGTPIVTGSTAVGSSCWLVVIPHGDQQTNRENFNNSGLFWTNFKHALAFKLDFKPVGVRCEIGAAEKQISGSELATGAIASWQPKLCAGPDGAAYVFSSGNEQEPLTAAATNPTAPLAMTSEPLGGQNDPLVYAPIAMSGVSISFAIDRRFNTTAKVPKSLQNKDQQPFTRINITPRILAKLLTGSYFDALPPGDRNHIGYKSYLNTGPNAQNISTDPDFLSVNDMEWRLERIVSVSLADAVVPIGRSDLANRIWQYVLSDQDAVDFLNGVPDPWGMKVNPYYSTDAKVNPIGSALSLPRRDFPKADPIEKPDTYQNDKFYGSGAINLVTWRPYAADFETGAYLTLRGDGLTLGNWNNVAVPAKYDKGGRNSQGSQRVLAITTTAAASKYQTISASLLNPAGYFVSPTRDSMAAASAAMVPTADNENVRVFDFKSSSAESATTAYPLTMPIYAAVNPTLLDPTLRKPYSKLIKFAASSGQVPGTELGQLPLGYAPLSEGMVSQALQAASLIDLGLPADSGVVPVPVEPTVAPSEPTNPSSPEPTYKPVLALLGAATQKDPTPGPAANIVPGGFVAGALAAFIYPNFTRIRRARRK